MAIRGPRQQRLRTVVEIAAHRIDSAGELGDDVAAALASGADSVRIIFGHILRNVLPPLLVQLALAMGLSVAIEASLSFVGIGIAPSDPSLGSILDASRGFLRGHAYYALFPGLTLALLLLGLNGLADTLNELLNPQL